MDPERVLRQDLTRIETRIRELREELKQCKQRRDRYRERAIQREISRLLSDAKKIRARRFTMKQDDLDAEILKDDPQGFRFRLSFGLADDVSGTGRALIEAGYFNDISDRLLVIADFQREVSTFKFFLKDAKPYATFKVREAVFEKYAPIVRKSLDLYREGFAKVADLRVLNKVIQLTSGRR